MSTFARIGKYQLSLFQQDEKTHTQAFLVRHAKPDEKYFKSGALTYGADASPEASLSQEGMRQAQEFAKMISIANSVYTTPFERARQTAQIIATRHGIPIKEIPELGDILANETMEQLEERVLTGFNAILKQEKGRIFVVVSHGHPTRLITLRHFEKYQGVLPLIGILEQDNYLNPGEAWFASWDIQGNLNHYQLLARPETKIPGKREMQKFLF